jgi:DinB family protein
VIDVDARPTLDEVLDVRAQRTATVAALLARSDEQDLARTVPNPNGGTTSVGVCIRVVLGEEWAHDRYANRDLDALGAPASG